MIYKGNHKLGGFFTSRRERGTRGLPMLSVTMNNGVVTRESLDRKMETNLSDEEHLLVRNGDIVYNMMRMWQGASGLADRDGLISPAYVVLAPKKGIDPLYASYLFKSPRLIYLLWAYSYGLTSDRLRLYFNDFKRIPVNIPSLPEQRKIGKILLIWDKAIKVTERLIVNSQQQKNALGQQLLFGERRLPGFSGQWQEKRLKNILIVRKEKSIPSEDTPLYSLTIEEGITQKTDRYNREFLVKDLESKKYKLVKPNDIVFNPANLRWGAINISKLKNDVVVSPIYEVVYVCNKDITSASFLAQYLMSSRQIAKFAAMTEGTLVERQAVKLEPFLATKIRIPILLDEQERIAQVLNAADKSIEFLQQKLACLKQEKKALMQQLLSGKRRVKVDES